MENPTLNIFSYFSETSFSLLNKEWREACVFSLCEVQLLQIFQVFIWRNYQKILFLNTEGFEYQYVCISKYVSIYFVQK